MVAPYNQYLPQGNFQFEDPARRRPMAGISGFDSGVGTPPQVPPTDSPQDPTVDPSDPNAQHAPTPTGGGGGGGGSSGMSGGGGASVRPDLWSLWETDAAQQLTDPEGLGNLDVLYGQTLDKFGTQFKGGLSQMQEGLSGMGLGRSPAGLQMLGDYTTQQSAAAGSAMQQVQVQDIMERLRQKDVARANILGAQQSKWQLEGQQSIARSNVGAARVQAEVGHASNLLRMMELGIKYPSNPYSTT